MPFIKGSPENFPAMYSIPFYISTYSFLCASELLIAHAALLTKAHFRKPGALKAFLECLYISFASASCSTAGPADDLMVDDIPPFRKSNKNLTCMCKKQFESEGFYFITHFESLSYFILAELVNFLSNNLIRSVLDTLNKQKCVKNYLKFIFLSQSTIKKA